jgi:hypothetical protein
LGGAGANRLAVHQLAKDLDLASERAGLTRCDGARRLIGPLT